MTLASMTGYARAEGHSGARSWIWEVKSVNGRGLDLRFRLPSGFDAIELPARRLAAERLKRGSVTVNLQLGPSEGGASYRVNRELLQEVVDLAREVQGWIESAPPRIDGLLNVRGVVEAVEAEEDEATTATREAALLSSLALALDRLVAARAAEGAQVAHVLETLIDEIERLAQAAARAESVRPEALRQRLKDQLEMLLGASPALSAERVAQEAALLITRLDVREELDRLGAHIRSARELVAMGDSAGAGRKLDFLSQELNREANTLCSKSFDAGLSRIGLDLKLAIDRFREQVQNIE